MKQVKAPKITNSQRITYMVIIGLSVMSLIMWSILLTNNLTNIFFDLIQRGLIK